jgi:hypothetical protein
MSIPEKRWSLNRPRKLGKAVASRTLTEVTDADKIIKLSLGMPKKLRRDEWRCSILIEGVGDSPIVDSAPGVDSFQALLLGIECIRWHLKESRVRLAWLGDPVLGELGGIPGQAPVGLGEVFNSRIEAVIERETERARQVQKEMLRRWIPQEHGSWHLGSEKTRQARKSSTSTRAKPNRRTKG